MNIEFLRRRGFVVGKGELREKNKFFSSVFSSWYWIMLRWFTTIEISVEIMLEGYMFLFIVIIVVIVALRGSIICGAFVEQGFFKNRVQRL